MGNKKVSKILAPVLGVMGFIMMIGIMEVTVLAENNVKANTTYTYSIKATDSKDYFVNINKSETQNGIKVTVDKAIVTKHKLKAILKVESEKPFDKTKQDNSLFEISYGENSNDYTLSFAENKDEKTMLVALERDNFEGEYPEKGEMKLDVKIPDYKVDIGMYIPVDFTESLKNTIEKDISVKIPNSNFTVNNLETNILGTRIIYSEPEKYYSKVDNNFSYYSNSTLILKMGEKMYQFKSDGRSYTSNDAMAVEIYEAQAATYERVKDKNDIRVIPVDCQMSWDEIVKISEANIKNGYTEKRNTYKQTINNVRYAKTFEFSNGSKGEIYNVERTDNSIKVYCKGNSEKESLLLASNMYMYYNLGAGKRNANNSVYASFNKDPKVNLGYIVEFYNVEKDKAVDIDFEYLVKYIDKFRIGDEIQISK